MKISTTVSLTFSLALGCGSPARGPATNPDRSPASSSTALARADLLSGDWVVAGSEARVTWLRPGGEISAVYGVAATAVPVAWVIDDAPPEAAPEARHLAVWRYQGEGAPRICEEKVGEPAGLVLTCEEGAGGVRFLRNGDGLDAEEWTATSGPDKVHLTPTEGVPAPELEAADRQFDADTAAKGAEGWVAWFADDATQWRETEAIRGHDQIRAAMTATLGKVDLRWQPTVSRMLASGTFGATAGTWTLTPKQGGEPSHGTYLTLWRKDPAGWRIVLDVGRPDQ